MSSGTPADILRRRFLGLAILGALISVTVIWSILNPEVVRFDAQDVIVVVQSQPIWVPIILVAVMAAAIVVSPVPSAPITIGASAVYGHYWGTLYAIAGAQLGAMVAFELSRRLGRERAVRRFGSIAARLLPAVSFDAVSYTAGLTPLKRLWFALATIAGIVPATFLLSHAGAGLRGSPAGFQQLLTGLGGLGLLVLAGMAVGVWRNRRNPELPRQERRFNQ